MRVADGRAADLARRREIASIAVGDTKSGSARLSKPVLALSAGSSVAKSSSFGKSLEGEQIADDVRVFGPAQAVGQRLKWAGIRPRRGMVVARAPGRRPHPCKTPAGGGQRPEAASFPRVAGGSMFFPGFGLITGVRDARRVQRQACGPRALVVTGDAGTLATAACVSAPGSGGFCEKPWEGPWNRSES